MITMGNELLDTFSLYSCPAPNTGIDWGLSSPWGLGTEELTHHSHIPLGSHYHPSWTHIPERREQSRKSVCILMVRCRYAHPSPIFYLNNTRRRFTTWPRLSQWGVNTPFLFLSATRITHTEALLPDLDSTGEVSIRPSFSNPLPE